jgi:hypothetical protein
MSRARELGERCQLAVLSKRETNTATQLLDAGAADGRQAALAWMS